MTFCNGAYNELFIIDECSTRDAPLGPRSEREVRSRPLAGRARHPAHRRALGRYLDSHSRSLNAVGHLAKRARVKNARDGTKYGRSCTSARLFYVHHTLRLSMATACSDVHGIFDSLHTPGPQASRRRAWTRPTRRRWPKSPTSLCTVRLAPRLHRISASPVAAFVAYIYEYCEHVRVKVGERHPV